MADIHIGSPFRGLSQLSEHVRQQMVKALHNALKEAVQHAVDKQVDFVLIAGDLFDQSQRSLRSQMLVREQFLRLQRAGIHVYMIHGNHDPLVEGTQLLDWPENVHVFAGGDVQCMPHTCVNQREVDIYGISYTRASETDHLAGRFQKQRDVFSIALLHTNCNQSSEHAVYAPCTPSDLVRTGIDYWALGHVHQRQVVHEDPWIVYPGNIQGRHIREEGEKGYYHVEVQADQQVIASFHSCAEVIWLQHTLAIGEEAESLSILFDILRQEHLELKRTHSPRSMVIRLTLTEASPAIQLLRDKGVRDEILTFWNELNEQGQGFVWLEQISFLEKKVFSLDILKGQDTVYEDVEQFVQLILENADIRQEVFGQALADLTEQYRMQRFLAPWSERDQQDMIKEAHQLMLQEWLVKAHEN